MLIFIPCPTFGPSMATPPDRFKTWHYDCMPTTHPVPEDSAFIEDWFTSRELNYKYGFSNDSDGLNRFWDWLISDEGCIVPGPKELTNAKKYYRGQTVSWYGFTSSLYRECKNIVKNRQVDEAHIAAAEQSVIHALREEGMGRHMTDGELLMICQHHSVPTRLIDVSTKPLEALYFAVEKEDGTDGRFFVVAPHQNGSKLPNSKPPLKLSGTEPAKEKTSSTNLPWANTVRGTRQSTNNWSIEVRLVNEDPLDPRMRAQAGKFLVGGVHRAYSGLQMSGISNIQRPDISSLAINFAPSTGTTKVSKSWGASGWSIRIHSGWKEELRTRLANLSDNHGAENITHDSMYPPVAQIERLGKYVAKQGILSAYKPVED